MQKYPSTLEKPYLAFHEQRKAGDLTKAFSYMRDFFETCSRYFSFVLIGLYKKHKDSVNDLSCVKKTINQIDHKRNLSTGDWAAILNGLAKDAIQQFPGNPFVKSVAEICGAKNNVILGDKTHRSFVQIRNESVGHDTTLSNKQAGDYIHDLEERMERLAETSKMVVECGLDLSKDLFPLVHTDENGFEYIFQTLTSNEKVQYTSNDEGVSMKTVKTFNAEFEAWMQELVPSFDIKIELNWSEICSIARAESEKFIQAMEDVGKYKRELFVERTVMKESIDRFAASDKLFFPILGEAGQGKSSQLCHEAEKMGNSDDFVLILNGSDFTDTTFGPKLGEIFAPVAKNIHFSQLIETFCKAASMHGEGRKIFFFIDAVNEAVKYPGSSNKDDGPQKFYQDLYSLFEDAPSDCVKVVLTCRSYTWKKTIAPILAEQNRSLFYTPNDESSSSLSGFQGDEIVTAYRNYKNRFQIKTAYEQLPAKCAIRLKDPLLLNFVCMTYKNQVLPEQSLDFTSIALFSKLLEKKSEDDYGSEQVRILEGLAERIFQDYESGIPSDSVDIPSLKGTPLHQLISYNEGKRTDAFSLLEKDKTLIRIATNGRIQFVYERFLEFMLARHCHQRERAGLRAGEPIPAERILNIYYSTEARTEVFVNVLQNVLIMDYTLTGNPETIIKLLKDHGHDFEIYNLVSAALNVMIHENYEKELFKLERELISHIPEDNRATITEYNKISKSIDANLADAAAIERHAQLTGLLTPLIRLRTLAAASIVNGMLLTDYNSKKLYSEDAYELLWLLMEDPIVDVRNTACMLAYYVSGKDKTLTGSPLERNITGIIIDKMHDYLLESGLLRHISTSSRRTRVVNFLETATRLNVLRIIDLMLTERPEDRTRAIGYLNETRNVMDHITAHFRMIKVLMPFLSIVLKRQLTFQSAYVNNMKEYSSFWDNPAVPTRKPEGGWSHEKLVEVSQFFYLYSRHFDQTTHSLKPDAPDFSPFGKDILSAYGTGDSFSYFVLERILVVAGVADWNTVAPIIKNLETVIQGSEWQDYSQMSFIYILYQLGLKMDEVPDMLWEMLGRNCVDWTERRRGYFKARNSGNANALGLYKRNVMTWYACVWCAHHGDQFDDQSVPLFRNLIIRAIDHYDKELLVHLIQNISELITDSGYIHTALGLLKIILERISDEETIAKFDKGANLRYPDTSSKLVPLIGKILGTAMNYYPREVTDFLTFETHGLTFPGIQKYRNETLGFNPGGERLPDLFTHKFGNFIIWALIHEQAVDDTVVECLTKVSQTDNGPDFFEKGARIVIRHLFNCKL